MGAAGDTQPTQPLPDWAYVDSAPEPRRRSPWPWIITIVIVAALAVGAWFLGESIARGIVEKTIRDQIVTRLALPADQVVAVDIPGAVLPQLIGGELDEVTVTSDDVPYGPLEGDITVTARGIQLRGEPVADSASGVVALDTAQLQMLMATVDGFPSESLGLAEPDITMSMDLSLFGVTVPIGVSLTPSASDTGDLVLTPASLQVGGADITSDELKRQFGILSNTVLRDWSVCIRQYMPSGIALRGAEVVGDTLVADFAIDGRLGVDESLQDKGTCAAS